MPICWRLLQEDLQRESQELTGRKSFGDERRRNRRAREVAKTLYCLAGVLMGTFRAVVFVQQHDDGFGVGSFVNTKVLCERYRDRGRLKMLKSVC